MTGDIQEELLPREQEGARVKHQASTGWVKITLIIVTNFLGTGVLSMPFAASQLGCVAFGGLLSLIFLAALLSGRAYARLFRALPESRAMADVGRAAYGDRGECVVRVVQYVYMCGVLVIFHLTCAVSLGRIFPGVCQVAASGAVAGCALCVLQLREMAHVGSLSVVGTGGILVCIGVVLAILPLRGVRPGAGESLAPPAMGPGAPGALVSAGVASMDVVFAFAGQIIYVELQSEMDKPKDFMKSVVASNAIMYVSYAAVALAGYHFVSAKRLSGGASITSAVASEGSLGDRVINAFLFVHVLVAYLIEGNVVARGFFLIAGEDANLVPKSHWTAMTAGLVAGAFVVSNLVPFFSDIMGFMSGLCAVLLCFTFPFAFVLRLCKDDLGSREAALYRCLVPVTCVFAVAGTAASAADIVQHFDSSRMPFAC